MRRRRFLAHTATGIAASLLKGASIRAAAPVHFTHGVASGDPLSDRVILWTRVVPGDFVDRPIECVWEVAADEGFSQIVARGQARADRYADYTVKVDAEGLLPGRRYFYRFAVGDSLSPVGRTRTLPVGAIERFSLGVCSCANYPQGRFHVYREMANADIDAIVHLGDYIYEYPIGFYDSVYARETLGRRVEPEHELLVLEDYRARYGVYRTDPDLQAAHAAHPFICVWDDHEIANDTWRTGAQNHNRGEGDFADRLWAARQAYCEWLPIRARPEQPIFRAFSIGDLADLIMLDTRIHGRDRAYDYRKGSPVHRDLGAFRRVIADPGRTLLGIDQEQWLSQRLSESSERGATWQVLGQQVVVGSVTLPRIPDAAFDFDGASGYARSYVSTMQKMAVHSLPLNTDAWDGYPAARERLFQDLQRFADNPVVLAGDTHNAWAFNLSDHRGRPIAVEIDTPSVNSSGAEGYICLPPSQWAAALRQANPHLLAADMAHRGWTSVSLTPESMVAQWHFVDDVLNENYRSFSGGRFTSAAGSRQLVRA
ncbi:alkaline phosphatase [Luminiphilus syltensis NOR5-1B]|uniref:Alkaline phosphatase n=1 Tax=Luminiphilus syltensis NOR5-1B TaxID=565045 RepID=B8KXM4_9GAMM|nr:alkaline phosphatase D family protein [Luminiphilus syltensis]EED35601.1 alkaline phosphatase [Luminiphilus syltensis NOR5-1B]